MSLQICPRFHPAPFTKLLTFFRKEPFTVSAYYTDQVPHPDNLIGELILLTCDNLIYKTWFLHTGHWPQPQKKNLISIIK